MPGKVRWEEMLPHEFVTARDRFPVAYMPYGLAEPHGAYNALGLDWLKASALVETVAQTRGGIVAPPFSWHISEAPEFHDDGHGHGWLVENGARQSLCSSLPADLFYRAVFYHVRALDARGFHAAILLTGHYGGIERVLRKICEYYLRKTGSPLRLHAIADWECIDADLPHRGDHAGVTETSQLMTLHPGLVDLNQRTVGPELGDRFCGGVNFEKGPLPSVEIGRKIVDSQVRNLTQTAERLLAEYQPRPGWRAPDLNQTEAIWQQFDRLTRRYWSLTLKEYLADIKAYGRIPDWDALERSR